MKVKTVTPELIKDAIETVNGNEQKIVYELHELEKRLNLKIEMRVVAQKKKTGYNITYCIKKPKRILFTIKTDTLSRDLSIKANLFHIDTYRNLLETSTDKIKESIKSTGSCVKCNPGCFTVKSQYTIDGIEYDPCYIKGHWFEGLDLDEWQTLKMLIENEYEANVN